MTGAALSGSRFGTAFDRLGVERAWSRTRGSPFVVIGIVSEGVQLDHPLLQPNIQRDYTHHEAHAGEHEIQGTHAAGVAAGCTSHAENFSGVAPGARILPVRYSAGPGPLALDLPQAIEYAVERGAHIVNAPGSSGPDSAAVVRALQYAAARNVLVVRCAARDCPAPRATPEVDPLPNQITVVPLAADDAALCATPADGAHLAAPGFARVPQWRGAGFCELHDAAVGASYVSGCAALVKSQNPGWGYHELREHLLASATAHGPVTGTPQGARLLDVDRAVRGPLELEAGTSALQWSALADATLGWRLRYASEYCVTAVAWYRPEGESRWRELGAARADARRMVIPADALQTSNGTLRLGCRESNFHADDVDLTIY